MTVSNRRSFRQRGVLQDIFQNDKFRKDDISRVREYDRSTQWIGIGTTGAPAFQNSWVNFSSGSDGNHLAAFMRDAAGIVHLRGCIKNGTIGTVAFTLPAGFRPGTSGTNIGTMRYTVVSATMPAAVYVAYDGTVSPVTGSGTLIDLAGITFPAEL